MTFLYKVLDAVPALPEELINSIDKNFRPVNTKFNARILRNWNNCNPTALTNNVQVHPTHSKFENWVKKNITEHIVNVGVNYVVVDTVDDVRSTGAHTDVVREYVLLWECESGGPNAELCFWQEENKPKFLPPKTASNDLSKLTLLDKIKLPKEKWILVNSTVLHSVENLYHTRINFQVSLLNLLAVNTINNFELFDQS